MERGQQQMQRPPYRQSLLIDCVAGLGMQDKARGVYVLGEDCLGAPSLPWRYQLIF